MGRIGATPRFVELLPVSRCHRCMALMVLMFAMAAVGNAPTSRAADPEDSKERSNRPNAAAVDRADEIGSIPESIRKLDLTDKQTEQIQKIVRDYNQTIGSVWGQFRDRYMQTIRLEASMLAAIEDHLTDTQRQKIRDHRHRTARHVKVTTSATERTNDNSNTAVKSNPAAEKPVAEIDTDLANVGVSLNSEQEAHADKIHQKYRTHFRPLNREIHSLHNRLVSLETEKLAEIEKVLTKEQLGQLRSNRQNASDIPKITLRTDESK